MDVQADVLLSITQPVQQHRVLLGARAAEAAQGLPAQPRPDRCLRHVGGSDLRRVVLVSGHPRTLARGHAVGGIEHGPIVGSIGLAQTACTQQPSETFRDWGARRTFA
jgi:hypothetical protein